MIGARPTPRLRPLSPSGIETTMQERRATDTDVFAEYHRRDLRRVLRGAAIFAAVVVLAGGVAGVTVIVTSIQQALRPAPTVLTAETLVSTVNSAQTAAKSTHFTVSLSVGGKTTTAEGDIVTGATAADYLMSMSMTAPGVKGASVKIVGGIAYVNLGKQTDGKYIVIDPANSADPLAASLHGLFSALDPARITAFPADTVSSVDVAGSMVSIDGVDAVPYSVVVNTSGLATALGLSDTTGLPPQIKYQYWIGRDNTLRRAVFELGGVRETITFDKWGEPVSITAPSADQLTTLDKLGG